MGISNRQEDEAIAHNTIERSIILEQNKRFSECLLWRMEREYFEKKGIDAWLHDVPFYITSNPFVAKAYAKVVIHFIRDWILKNPEAKNHPFYVMELGTGPGRFSYYTVKILDELRKDYGMHDVKIVYVMTDFAKANLDYYESHHALIPYVEQGLLDFAIHDMDKKIPIKLMHSKVELNQETLVNPISVFANYVFDTITNDSFTVRDGKLYELLVDLSTPVSNLKNNQPIDLDRVAIDHKVKEIHGAYYNDPALDAVLELYKNTLQDTSFLIPIGSIRALDHLRKLANGKLLLISSDKAFSEITELDNLSYPSLTVHGGCFSMMVNCHAIGQYFKNSGGDFFSQSPRRGLRSCVYTAGIQLNDLPETRVAVKDYIEKFSPTDFFNIYRHFNETSDNAEANNIVSYLQLTEWDPHAFMRIRSKVLSMLSDIDYESATYLAKNLHKLAENYYFMPSADCILFEVATVFHGLKYYREALQYYQRAEAFLPEQFALKYNIALCLHHLDQNEEALRNFNRAGELNPESQEVKDWVDYLEKMNQPVVEE